MKSTLAAVLLASVLAGCISTYHPYSGLGSGYTETALAPNMYRVDFIGDGLTDVQQVQDYALLRGAEITIEKGFKYFAVINSNTDLNQKIHTTPVTVNTTVNSYKQGNGIVSNATSTTSGGHSYETTKPSSSNLILLLQEKPVDVIAYDAEFLISSIKKKYEIEDAK